LARAADESAVSTRLEQVAASYTNHNKFMGTVLAVHGDHVLLDKGYGMANLDWGIPNHPDVRFRLGSLTKQFTAALVLLLQEDGKLNIDDPVPKYLPDVPKTWQKINIAHLLGHTSGIPSFTGFKEFRSWSMSPHTPEQELEFFRDKPLDFEPGSKFDYSNSNFILLGILIEKVSGKKYADLLRERILDPLGMKDTGLDNDALILPRRAQGYSLDDSNGFVVARSESMSIPWAAGAMYSTTHDLLKWDRALFGGKVLSHDSLRRMTTPGKGDYGLGLNVQHRDRAMVVDHGGGIEGFNTHLTCVPESEITVVVLGNVNSTAPTRMADQLLAIILGKPITLPGERTPVPISSQELAKFAGSYDLAPDFSVTIAVKEGALFAQATGQPEYRMNYQGVTDGHPRFYQDSESAELEFVPAPDGTIPSLILHHHGQDLPGKRH
jgi:CubicO group peptidase (beta-lactamase class C family)